MSDVTCQYIGPEQDPMFSEITFCGKKSIEGKSYCHDHYWKVYRKGTSVNGKRKQRQIEREIEELKKLEEDDTCEP